ncbi:MAG: SurA N-terminal domain-containing protein [Alphaproteobacteria bacterium]|nr:SurA N-terminal domain-containing protein [Alphaproteobacteria bacterium]
MILKSFRNASNSLVVKILFSAIILSFCLWGVGDIIRNYSASRPVLSVNKIKVTVDQFLHEFSQEKQRIRNLSSQPLTDDEVDKLNIRKLVLDKLTNDAVLQEMYRKLNIIIPKKSLVDIIHSLPEFQRDGGFDGRIYETAIRHSGINEAAFLEQIKESVARTQLIHPIAAGYKLPAIAKESIAKEFEAQNTVLLATVDVNTVKYDKKISDDELKQHYNNNLNQYKKPEIRDVSVLIVDYRKLAGDLSVSEKEIEEAYEKLKASNQQRETRDFERFIFDERENADKAWKLLNKGTSSAEVIKKLTPKVGEIKAASSSDFPEKVAKELFSLKVSKTSEVYHIGGKYYIYKLTKITKPETKSEAQVKADIRKELQDEKLNSSEFYAKVNELKDRIDDAFGAGKTIEEVSKETGMSLKKLPGLQKGKKSVELEKIVPDEGTRAELLDNIFSGEEGQASQTIASKEDDALSYVVVVDKIQKAAVPDFSKIKKQVLADYVFTKKNKIALDDINGIVSQRTVATGALKKKYPVKTFKFSKRDLLLNKERKNGEVERILKEMKEPNVILSIISSLKTGEATHYELVKGKYLVVGIEKVEHTPTASKEFFKTISDYVDASTSADVSQVALSAFKKKLKIDVNEKLIDEVTKRSVEMD